jgi:uncharacterized protein YdeI (YjbR/CyaY-like superfamily)
MSIPAPRSFRTPAAWRAWLEKHHQSATELAVRCFKVHASDRGVTYKQALDEALCFGWIDGVRHAIDDDSFRVRFSPRKPVSKWSAVNVRRVEALEREGRMHATGAAAFRARDPKRPTGYSFESQPVALAPELARRLAADAKALAYFESRPPWYRRTVQFWVMSAKRPETRGKRYALLLDCSRRGVPIPGLDRTPRSPAKKSLATRAPVKSSRARKRRSR